MKEDAGITLELRFSLNGVMRSCAVATGRRLADILREQFGLMAVRTACEVGRCGACMVVMNGRPVNACLVMAWQVDGATIVTAEGLDVYPEASVVKEALTQENAFQCGYCASGFVVSLTMALHADHRPDPAAVRRALEGNICRCTGYYSILRGARRAVEMLVAAEVRQDDPQDSPQDNEQDQNRT